MVAADHTQDRASTGRRTLARVGVAVGAAALGFALALSGIGVLRGGESAPATTLAPLAPVQPSAAAEEAAGTSSLDVGVVDIDTRLGYDNGRAAGTGMIITSAGKVLTNAHVIRGATTIKITVVTTGRTYDATVLGSDRSRDVALLQIEGASVLDTVKLGDSGALSTGDPVTAVGNAGGEGGIPSVSPGTITALDQTITVGEPGSGEIGQLSGLIQTDAVLEPGDSGGPMYDAEGVVIGISTAADTGRGYQAGRESYAVAIDTAESIAEQISAGQGSSTIQIGIRGFLGVQLLDSAGAGGAVIDSVLDGTPAADAGLRSGDVITAVGGQRVESQDGLSARLHGHQPGDEVEITWTDGAGVTRQATVTLARGPA
jgi:S1-C subfamily serine protease